MKKKFSLQEQLVPKSTANDTEPLPPLTIHLPNALIIRCCAERFGLFLSGIQSVLPSDQKQIIRMDADVFAGVVYDHFKGNQLAWDYRMYSSYEDVCAAFLEDVGIAIDWELLGRIPESALRFTITGKHAKIFTYPKRYLRYANVFAQAYLRQCA